jgi:hypothetical protein
MRAPSWLPAAALLVPVGRPPVLGSVFVVEPNSWVDTIDRAPVGQAECHTRRNSAQPHEMGVKRAGDG